jgi:TonB family protein
VDPVEDRLEEAPVNHGIALGSLDAASLPAHVDAARVERTIAKQLGTIRDCMERKRRRNASRGGKVKVAITILPAGGVSDARTVYNGTGSPVAASCVLASVRKLTFDPSPTGQTSRVEYSFVFGGSAPSLAAVP